MCLPDRRRSSDWLNFLTPRIRDFRSAPSPHGCGAPNSSESPPSLTLPPVTAGLSTDVQEKRRDQSRGRRVGLQTVAGASPPPRLEIMSEWPGPVELQGYIVIGRSMYHEERLSYFLGWRSQCPPPSSPRLTPWFHWCLPLIGGWEKTLQQPH